ncbi:unnamed protein product [Bathycoccus prasinos]
MGSFVEKNAGKRNPHIMKNYLNISSLHLLGAVDMEIIETGKFFWQEQYLCWIMIHYLRICLLDYPLCLSKTGERLPQNSLRISGMK